jgi:nucleoside-diphosphate-sugar epimerase
MAKKVLITGASGFVGRHCARILQADDYEVHAVSSQANAGLRSGVQWHQADLLREDSAAQLLREVRPSHLLHLAWFSVPGAYWTSTENISWVQASLNLLQLFRAAGGQRVAMAGTCAEYDWTEGYCSESITKLAPATLYGTCKHALRLMLEAYAGQTGLSAAWGRLFFLYGPHENPKRLVASVIRSLHKDEPALCSAGDQQRDFLYVEDAAAAFVALLKSDVSGPVNIASGKAIAIKDIVQQLGVMMNRQALVKLGAIPAPPDEPPLLVADVERLQKEVGWQPRVDLKQGLATTIEWWQHSIFDK